ncbi:hypothetical protein ACO2Q0_14000 [Phenylobacterium sp. VNQ135]|uniref:hypothetical protein n=1 Tax=Phenylobacterium sp. VNQ135 TaxID=3400922 RepID=UPI003BFF5DD0
MSAIFLTLHNPAGADLWPEEEVGKAPPCPVARFTADDRVWTISGGSGNLPVRWIRAPDRPDIFFLMTGPALADAEAWDKAGRRGLPSASAKPGYYLVSRRQGMNFLIKAYDGPPSARTLADDATALLQRKAPPLAVHDPVGDAISLYMPTEAGDQVEIFRPQDIGAGGYAAIYYPDGHFFTYPAAEDDDSYVMRGSGFACTEAMGSFKRRRVGIHSPSDAGLELGCELTSDNGYMDILVTHRPSPAQDKATWEAAIAEFEKETGVLRRLSAPKMGPRESFQGGRNWLGAEGNVYLIFFMRRGEYVIEIRQMHDRESLEGANQALMALLEQVDLPDAKSAEGWRARR